MQDEVEMEVEPEGSSAAAEHAQNVFEEMSQLNKGNSEASVTLGSSDSYAPEGVAQEVPNTDTPKDQKQKS